MSSINSPILLYLPHYFIQFQINKLVKDIPFEQESFYMYGKKVQAPRLTAYMGQYPYRYSGIDHPALAYSEEIGKIRDSLFELVPFEWNAVLLNYYRNGQDSMSYHRDNEKGIDQRLIASISFGAARKFSIRHKETKDRYDIMLEHGSLLIMIDCQEEWGHALPKTKKVNSERLNLTFRHIDPQ
jgi:alkylated DNA repair dioxygenase AlkB